MSVKKIIAILGVVGLFLSAGTVWADDDELQALFSSSLAPDALIVLDLSGSMNASPLGDILYARNRDCVANTTSCVGTAYDCADGYCALVDLNHDGYIDYSAPCQNRCFFPYGADSSCTPNTTACSGTKCIHGFCASSKTGCSTDCSRLGIAKRALFGILDDDGSNTISGTDETSLGVRVGFMRFYNATSPEETINYSYGYNKLTKSIGTKYSNIFCGSNSSCAYSIPYVAPSNSCTVTSINSGCASGATPLVLSLKEAKAYLDAHKTADGAAGACRPKFIVFISDGADTTACGGDGSETQANMYKRRRASVHMAKTLHDTCNTDGSNCYRMFVIGFGANMPAELKNTLNWMAYYGGTDNPLVANTGDPSAYTVQASDANSSSGCATESTGTIGADCPYSSPSAPCFAATRDPGNTPLDGYAFIATNADEVAAQLKAAFSIIREATYSFSMPSVQLNRKKDENFIYEGSIQPRSNDPFWFGHLKKYGIQDNGDRGDELWDAGVVLAATAASSRNIKSYLSGTSLIDFNTTNISAANLGVATTALQSLVIGFFRGEAAYNIESWKLGDIFRSKPITIGTPSFFFEDIRDSNKAFASFRSSHQRNSDPYTGRVVVVGANDGQLHAFKTSDGSEAWSFVPPSLLTRLKLIAHNTHPTSLTHTSYVDGPVTVADAWVPATASDGTSKSASDWRTHLLFGLGQGAGHGTVSTLWSASSTCTGAFSEIYSSSYPNYCGYYCLDVTSTENPTLCGYQSGSRWLTFNVSAAAAPYLGAPWSAPMVGRVKDGGLEKWVAIIGGGYPSSGAANSAKGLFVFDLRNGSLLWSYTKANNSGLNYAMPAPPAIVDTDSDGFIDMVYIGDINNNMWRFKFCRSADGDSCTTSNWTGNLFFDSTNAPIRPIYTSATVAKDTYNNVWVYWGTGDKTDPTAPNAQEKLYALKDTDFTSSWRINNMENITSEGATYSGTAQGWYINMTGGGEKILAEPTVFGGVVYWTSYTPPSGNDPCAQGGEAKLYGVNYTTGAGAIDLGGGSLARSISIGTGIPSAPVVSMRPGNDGTPDLYVTASGGGGTAAETFRVNFDPRGLANRTNIIYWKDKRVE